MSTAFVNEYVLVRWDSEGNEYDLAGDDDAIKDCCNMDQEALDKIPHIKMPVIFANEYGPYDRKVGKGMLKNNDSLV